MTTRAGYHSSLACPLLSSLPEPDLPEGRVVKALFGLIGTEVLEMFYTRYPAANASQIRRELGDLFDGLLRGWPVDWNASRGFPAVNLWEDDEAIRAEAELPGLNMNDIEVLVVGDELTIKGRRTSPENKDFTYHRRERGTGEFSRTLTLPYPVNADRVEATLKNGVMTLILPKAETARPRKITVKSN